MWVLSCSFWASLYLSWLTGFIGGATEPEPNRETELESRAVEAVSWSIK